MPRHNSWRVWTVRQVSWKSLAQMKIYRMPSWNNRNGISSRVTPPNKYLRFTCFDPGGFLQINHVFASSSSKLYHVSKRISTIPKCLLKQGTVVLLMVQKSQTIWDGTKNPCKYEDNQLPSRQKYTVGPLLKVKQFKTPCSTFQGAVRVF